MADIARGVMERGRLSGPVLVEGSALGTMDRQCGVARTAGNATRRCPAAGGFGSRGVTLGGDGWGDAEKLKTNKVGPMVGEQQQNS